MRYLVQLAESGKAHQSYVGKWWSYKLDGMRCLWDGGVTIGWQKSSVPWANNNDPRKRGQISTGLWSRAGNIIHAPKEWTDELPRILLDGELLAGTRQETLSIVRAESGRDWNKVGLFAFDSPSPFDVFVAGEYCAGAFRGKTLKINIDRYCPEWWQDMIWKAKAFTAYHLVYAELQKHYWNTVPQLLINRDFEVNELLAECEQERKEGIMVRDPNDWYKATRHKGIQKIKVWDDDEAKVIGYTEAKAGSKIDGLVGALVVNWQGRVFELSGMTDEERQWGKFPVGTVVTFRYRGLTDDGLPNCATYWREADQE
jgi:DNA ligase-1